MSLCNGHALPVSEDLIISPTANLHQNAAAAVRVLSRDLPLACARRSLGIAWRQRMHDWGASTPLADRLTAKIQEHQCWCCRFTRRVAI
jgi:hypothetical protein